MNDKIKSLTVAGALALASLDAGAYTQSWTIPVAGCSNLIGQNARVTQVVITAPTATNATLALYDSPNTNTSYVLAGYTNISTYATNLISVYTNFMGVLNTNTLYTNVLVDYTNNVAASTNSYPLRLQLTALSGTAAIADNVNYYFGQGVTATNTSTGTATVTLTWFGQ